MLVTLHSKISKYYRERIIQYYRNVFYREFSNDDFQQSGVKVLYDQIYRDSSTDRQCMADNS
jgi:hypothetical protein